MTWSRLFGQISRFDKWNSARVRPPSGLAANCVLRNRLDLASCRQGSSAGGGDYTTKLKNAHRTAWREVLYRFHPWSGRDVCVHAMIERAGSVVFRCTLDGSDAARWLEIPAWMFDRALCPHEPCLAQEPFAGVEALKALSALLDQALKTAVPSSNAPLSDAFEISHDQNRRESHVSQGDNAGDHAPARPAKRFAADGFVQGRGGGGRHTRMDGTSGGRTGRTRQPDDAVAPETCTNEPSAVRSGGRQRAPF